MEDDDGVWEDTVTPAPPNTTGQTRDASQQWLSQPFDGHPVHSLVQLRVTFDVTVTWPDGSVHTGEANQLRLTDATTGTTTDYIIFQFKVPPGSTVDFTAVSPTGNTAYADFPCYGAGTLIDTPDGARPIERLCAGDLVLTADRGPQPVLWIAQHDFSAEDLMANPHLVPVRIAAGALGNGLPRRDLMVSPQHRILLRSRIVARVTGGAEVMVPAKKLLSVPGISLAENLGGISYWHFACALHEVIFAEGVPSETLFPGPQALEMLGPEGARELLAILPQVAEPGGPVAGADAAGLVRPGLRGRQLETLLERHRRNAKPLVGMA